jgi:hypothetical protein
MHLYSRYLTMREVMRSSMATDFDSLCGVWVG